MNSVWIFIILLSEDFVDLWSFYWHRCNVERHSPALVSAQKCRSKEVLAANSPVDLLLKALCFPFPMLVLKKTDSGGIHMCYKPHLSPS